MTNVFTICVPLSMAAMKLPEVDCTFSVSSGRRWYSGGFCLTLRLKNDFERSVLAANLRSDWSCSVDGAAAYSALKPETAAVGSRPETAGRRQMLKKTGGRSACSNYCRFRL